MNNLQPPLPRSPLFPLSSRAKPRDLRLASVVVALRPTRLTAHTLKDGKTTTWALAQTTPLKPTEQKA